MTTKVKVTYSDGTVIMANIRATLSKVAEMNKSYHGMKLSFDPSRAAVSRIEKIEIAGEAEAITI